MYIVYIHINIYIYTHIEYMYGQSMMYMVDVLCSRIALSQWEEDCPWCLLVRTNQRLKRKPKHHRRRTGDIRY